MSRRFPLLQWTLILLLPALLLCACTKEVKKPVVVRRTPALPVYAPPPTPIATVQRLTSVAPEVRQHEMTSETKFPKALEYLTELAKATPDIRPRISSSLAPSHGLTPNDTNSQLVPHDWVGVVLRPLNTNADLLHTMQVEIEAIEAHPLENGSVRIWVRVRNHLDRSIHTEIGCSFTTIEHPEPPRTKYFDLDIPADDSQDIFFVSPKENVANYVLLIRGENTVRSLTSTSNH